MSADNPSYVDFGATLDCFHQLSKCQTNLKQAEAKVKGFETKIQKLETRIERLERANRVLRVVLGVKIINTELKDKVWLGPGTKLDSAVVEEMVKRYGK